MKIAQSADIGTSALDVLTRLLKNGRQRFTPALAKYLLGLDFEEREKKRMHELAVRNQDGALSEEEWIELESYAQAGCLLGILQSKARQSLRKAAKPRTS
jgi:hypothetical protein